MGTTIISLFNHKGGVSKTTTAFNLGWALAASGHRVLLVDGDPQCNLTGMTLGMDDQDALAKFYKQKPDSNLYSALRPAFGGQPEKLKPCEPQATGHPNLFILAGHIDVATYEPELSMAHKLVGAMPVLQNLPGAMGHLMRLTADLISADYVLVDMSPSIGALNQNLLLQSDYFIVPTSPDYFCLMAIDSLAKVIPEWHRTGVTIRAMQGNVTYRIPAISPVFVGMISQRYRPRSGKPASAFQTWIDAIVSRVQDVLVPALEQFKMAIPASKFESAVSGASKYELAQIADFNSLIAQSQSHATPVFALSEEQLDRVGVVLEQMLNSRDQFRETFSNLAKSVINLCPKRE